MRGECFFFNGTATTEIYTYGHTLSLHDALPISASSTMVARAAASGSLSTCSATRRNAPVSSPARSEEHTSELQSLMRISYAVFCLKEKMITEEGMAIASIVIDDTNNPGHEYDGHASDVQRRTRLECCV